MSDKLQLVGIIRDSEKKQSGRGQAEIEVRLEGNTERAPACLTKNACKEIEYEVRSLPVVQ